MFPFAQGLALPTIQYDHSPIIIRLVGSGIKRRSPFKFETKRLQDDECNEVIKKAWVEVRNEASPPNFRKHIANTRRNLKEWNKIKFGNLKKQMDSIANRITEIQKFPPTNNLLKGLKFLFKGLR
ncbi:hypothetical protein V6N13_015110 [Hibiscus sabdariffa]|uniref:Uncharacterized protein n=2 Tax=Hibiscus sabdariffa TaxID=183260 RepID=A0ABR2B0L7_9ROSI